LRPNDVTHIHHLSFWKYKSTVLILVQNHCTVKGVTKIYQENFATRLREIRQGRNLTAVELGKLVGISKQAMREIESGRSGPTLERASVFAEVLDVSLDYLVGLSDEPKRR